MASSSVSLLLILYGGGTSPTFDVFTCCSFLFASSLSRRLGLIGIGSPLSHYLENILVANAGKSSMMNGMQALSYWQEYFGHPKGGQLGLLVACYNLGAITSIPFVAIVSDHLGRRKSIVLGSTIMIIVAIMQGLSQNCEFPPSVSRRSHRLVFHLMPIG